jgi:2,4-dienoyl-CoA reductase-like NADH-dependent reductase (Old Yellow Enzyme family)
MLVRQHPITLDPEQLLFPNNSALTAAKSYDTFLHLFFKTRLFMKTLFDKTSVNGMELGNRFVRSATWEGMCDEHGRPGPKLAECYRQLAKGKVGLIVTGYTFVRMDGKQTRGSLGIHKDDLAPELKAVCAAVHAEGGKLCVQLVHTGGQARVASGTRLLAPSAIQAGHYSGMPSEMTQQDIDEVVAAFGAAAKRAKDWRFDAVQIHAAHGYLINQFLSPNTNHRTDAYGGSIQNRCRFMLEVYRSVRAAVGAAYPVIAKLNASDFMPDGFTIEDALFAARLLDNEGIDAIEVSGGTPASGENTPVRRNIGTPEQEGYHLPLAKEIKAAVKCSVMVVGGFRSFDLVKNAVEQDDMDYISLARPFVREPGLVTRWQQGDRSRSRCISCNGCYRPGLREGGIYCIVEKAERKKAGEPVT